MLRTATAFDPASLELEREPFELAELLVKRRDAQRFLQQLVDRHRRAKGEAPWVTLLHDRIKVLAVKKNLPDAVRPRTYRLDAFKQLLLDLRLIQ